MKILITCPNLINSFSEFEGDFKNFDVAIPEIKQTISFEDIIKIIKGIDIWIAGDEHISFEILKRSNIKLLIKWGVGTDMIDLEACKKLKIPFFNTPNVFGNEVADIAIGYMINMVRKLHIIDREVRKNNWLKITGNSFSDKSALILGYGNIGKQIEKRLSSFDIRVYFKDVEKTNYDNENVDYIFISCPLTVETYKMVDKKFLENKKCSLLINVSRGSIVNEKDILELVKENKIMYASDVFEKEPLINSEFYKYDNVMIGSHNASNTKEGIERVNRKIIEIIDNFCKTSLQQN